MALSAAAAQAGSRVGTYVENVNAEKGKFENNICTKEGGKKEFEWVKLKAGTKEVPNDVQVTTKGTLILTALEREIECTVKDAGSIWNPAGGGAGEDEITEFTNTNCKVIKGSAICTVATELEVLAVNLPWYTILENIGGVIERQNLRGIGGVKGIEIAIDCNKTVEDVFTGMLTPKIGVNVAEFGAGSGELEDAAKHKATVAGKDEIEGPVGKRGVTAKEP